MMSYSLSRILLHKVRSLPSTHDLRWLTLADSQRFFMRDLYRALLIEYEAVVVEKAMVRNTALMKSLSNLAALAPNTYPPNVCKTLQSIRSSAVLYTMFYNKNSPASQETVDLGKQFSLIMDSSALTPLPRPRGQNHSVHSRLDNTLLLVVGQ